MSHPFILEEHFYVSKNRKIQISFVDYMKAFDSLSKSMFWMVMRNTGIPL